MESSDRCENRRLSLRTVTAALLLSAELCLAADLVLALNDHAAGLQIMLPVFFGLSCLFAVIGLFHKKLCGSCCLIVTALLLLSTAGTAGIWFAFYKNAVYHEPDNGLTASDGSFFRDRNVMLIVPHQDDDLNLLGGVLEEYTAGGSRVTVVFTTNGDYLDLGGERIREAVNVLGTYGIPEENVIFLGYGDGWEGEHIYNSPENELKTSHAGYTETYGTEEHPAYRNGISYTLAHYTEDLQNVITEVRPEVIYCVDQDSHTDHRASSLLFDRVMGRIRKEEPDYIPLIFKGFAYSTAYFAEEDFYSLNMRSTTDPEPGGYASSANIFRWEDRIRIPVAGKSLSRSILNADLYRKTRLYQSQNARFQAVRMISGDRVFWQRDCSGVAYTAAVTATSGEAWRLNDFMLQDSTDVTAELPPFDGTWIPDGTDTEKQAVMTFGEPVTADRIVLYDNPSLQDNIINAELTLYTESEENEQENNQGNEQENKQENKQEKGKLAIKTGQLKSGGEGTEFTFDPVKIRKIEVCLLESEGSAAGLTELEVYAPGQKQSTVQDSGTQLLKLCDSGGNFVYDYIFGDNETEFFSLYTVNCSADLNDYEVDCTGEACTAEADGNGSIRVCVPKGKQCVLTVRSPDGAVSDSVILRNNGLLMKLGQGIESFVYHNYGKLQSTAAYSLARWVFHLFHEENLIL